jgi:hypothetical protein
LKKNTGQNVWPVFFFFRHCPCCHGVFLGFSLRAETQRTSSQLRYEEMKTDCPKFVKKISIDLSYFWRKTLKNDVYHDVSCGLKIDFCAFIFINSRNRHVKDVDLRHGTNAGQGTINGA